MNSILPRLLPLALLISAALILVTCAHRQRFPEMNSAEQRALVHRNNFVYVADAVPGVVIDLRYATRDNVASKRLYPDDMPCLLHRDTAEKLLIAQRVVATQGFRLKIWDAWRPPSSHMALWYSNPNPDYVAPPETGLSFHTYGVAVDVTLTDVYGNEVPMPSTFDEFSPRAWSSYTGNDAVIRQNVALLQSAMTTAGFNKIESEWWHFLDINVSNAKPVFARELGIELPVPLVQLKVD